jgi:hypothetical protein
VAATAEALQARLAALGVQQAAGSHDPVPNS